jgi:carboxymethylenebutenolidase
VGGQSSAIKPRTPLQSVADIKCPILGLFGEADTGIPVSDLRPMETAMREAGKRFTLVIYPGAPHGFHADYRPSCRKEVAEAGRRLMLEFLRANGVA